MRGDRRVDVGQVEDARLGRELGVEDDLEEQVAELLGEGRRRAAAERVVDLVGLLEEVVPERLVGLLAVPRAAVRQAQAVRDPGHRPRARDGHLAGDRRQVERRRRDPPPSSSPIVEALGRAEPADRMVGRDRAGEDAERVVDRPDRDDRAGRRAARPRRRRRRASVDRRTASGDEQRRPGRLERRSRRGVSAATTWRPATRSRPQRSRASATSASSTAGRGQPVAELGERARG